jgi:methenyltetrahydromethanopterin cyclohydrolase
VTYLLENLARLRLTTEKLGNGTTVIDAGINTPGGLEAGRLITEICMGGLGTVSITAGSPFVNWPWQLNVHSSNPVIACLGSQYAGWSLSHGEGKGAFNALGSGPARAMGSSEELFKELAYKEEQGLACMVIEADKLPPVEIADKIAHKCGISPAELTLIMTPTSSLAGSVQVVGRVLEVSMHVVHTLHFPLDQVIDGAGTAPVCPPARDFLTAMGRTNDAILFGGQVHLFVNAENDDTRQLAEQMPSCNSRDYGKPFAEIFKAVNYDFYQIDPMLFAPARVAVTSMKTGKTYHAGKLDEALLEQSFS